MKDQERRNPLLHRHYRDYLQQEDTAGFIRNVSQKYTIGTLTRLAKSGARITRRAAILALGLVGGYEVNSVLGRALRDRDRGVRLLAEAGIRQVWLRDGNESQRQQLRIAVRLNNAHQFKEALEYASRLVKQSPRLAEAWNQRAIAYFCLGNFPRAIHDCRRALKLNPFHFGAASGMAQAHLEMDNPTEALECFRKALQLNPALESVRAEVHRLKRQLRGRQ